MRRYRFAWLACGAFLFQGGFAVAQNTLETLEQELQAAKQQHQEVTSQVMTNFFSQIDAAMTDPNQAVNLYGEAITPPSTDDTPPVVERDSESALEDMLRLCGIPPTPVTTEHTTESATEKAARLAIDQANLARLGAVLQLHCGLMHYAALFVTEPDRKGLQDEWVAWLKSAPQIYQQAALPAALPGATGDQNPGQPRKKKKNGGNWGNGAPPGTPPPPFDPREMREKTMRDSIISKYLGFRNWGDRVPDAIAASDSSSDSKDRGNWAVRDLPKLYRTDVLEPLRVMPTAATLEAWDTYIAMANADERDNDRWNEIVYPPLQFDRACDDYTVAPSTEKLEGLVNLIKANPTNLHADDWIARVRQLMDAYRASHGGPAMTAQNPATAPAPSATATDPNVTVTAVQQGDATIITTHTNAAPVTPAPPAPAPPAP